MNFYKPENQRLISEAKNPDLRGIPAALARAALRAQELAKQTNT